MTRLYWLLGALGSLPLLWVWRALFSPYAMPMRGDPELPGQWGDFSSFSAPLHLAAVQMLFDEGAFPLWNRFVHSGEPFFATPQLETVGPAMLLAAVFPFPIAIKLSVLLHVLLGGAAIAVIAHDFGAGRLAALASAGLYICGPYYVLHFHRGHINYVAGAAYGAWILVFALRAIRALSWPVSVEKGVFCGAMGALAMYTGGEASVLYVGILLVVVCVCTVAAERSVEALKALLVLGLVAGVSMFVLAAPRLLAVAEYMRLANRREGVPWSMASQPGEELPGPAVHVVGIVVAALALFVHREQRALAVGLVLTALFGWRAAHHLPTFRFLYDHIPPFNTQRHPQRMEVLVAISVPILWVLASSALKSRQGKHWWLSGIFSVVMLACVWIHTRQIPPATPVVDARVEPAANPLLQRVKPELGDQRLHFIENVDRHWGVEHVTIPNGIEHILGHLSAWQPEYLSPQQYMPQQVAFLDGARVNPVRIFSLLSVSHVSSMRELSLPGLSLVDRVPPCAVCQPKKSAGPWLYRNELALPRMYTVGKALLFVGTGPDADAYYLSMLTDPAWDPARSVLLRTGIRGHVATPEQLAAVDAVVVHGDAVVDEKPARVVHRVRGRQMDDAMRSVLAGLGEQTYAIVNQERSGNTYRGCVAQPGFLVATSKFAFFKGWSAEGDDGKALPLWIANGVVSAVPVQSGCVTLRYRPNSVLVGAGVMGVGIPVCVVLVRWARKRRQFTPTHAAEV